MLFLLLVFTGTLHGAPQPTTQTIDADRRVHLPKTHDYRPAQLYWGAYRNMDQLASAGPDDWAFARAHADGLLFHEAYWLRDPSAKAVAIRLGEVLRNSKQKHILEIGWPHWVEPPERFADMGVYYGKLRAGEVADLQKAGLEIAEVNVDWRIFIFRLTAQQFPHWSARDVMTQVTGNRSNYPANGPAGSGYWSDFVREFGQVHPKMPIQPCWTPVQMPWGDLSAYGKTLDMAPLLDGKGQEYLKGKPLLVDGRPVSFRFDGKEIFESIFDTAPRNPLVAGFVTDSPFGYNWTWPDLAKQIAHRTKIRLYEQWLHQRGLQHTFICNAEGVDWKSQKHDEADRQFAELSLEALQRYQLDGGRADRYLLESWYDGPYSIVPESKNGSYTHLVGRAARYLKGIDQSLELEVVSRTQSPDKIELRLTNRGSDACLPAIRSSTRVAATFKSLDISGELHSEEGFVPGELLLPSQSLSLTLGLDTTPIRPITIEAFWNPQMSDRRSYAQLQLP